MEARKTLLNRKISFIGIAILSVIVLLGVGLILLGGNKHYKAGVKHLEAKNFDDAVSEFNLWIAKDEDNLKAKGLLFYAKMRRGAEKETVAAVKKEIRKELINYQMLSNLKEANVGIPTQEERKEWQQNLKEQQKKIREKLKDIRVYTKSWDELGKILAATAKEVYALKIDVDDELDVFCKDVAAAILASKGDDTAARFLVKRATQDESLIELFPLAGRALVEPLKQELASEESLIYDKAMASLKLLFLESQVTAFYQSHPKLRQISEKDFKEEDKLIYQQLGGGYSLVDNQFVLLSLSETFKKAKYDLSACKLYLLPLEAAETIAHLAGYDSESKKFYSRFYLWKGLEWRPLKARDASGAEQNELENYRFTSYRLEFNPEKSRIAVGIPKVEKIKSVRTEEVWNPTKYRDAWGNFQGGYEEISREYEEPGIKMDWWVYDFSPEQGMLKFIEKQSSDEPFTTPE